jgi:hypothetical protein
MILKSNDFIIGILPHKSVCRIRTVKEVESIKEA